MIPEIVTPETKDFTTELQQIGLVPELLREISERILLAFKQKTSNDAAGADGIYAYLAAVRAFRDMLCPMGWSIDRRHNLEIIENRNLKVSISVSSGDKNTGKKDEIPKTKNPKGEQTREIVYQNARNSLFYEFDQKHTSIIEIKPFWIFLYHIDTKISQMRTEISLPLEMDFYGTRVENWGKRIILNTIDFPPSPVLSDPDFVEEVEFEIKRRSNDKL
ncbi:MAG: hypothetical protein KKE62_05970 [Proteobacteria bacterium]|nr:hypothetical protein [Pseudomonadota bacterium]MBU1542374.1 hypothetical protein [Pseudomonadota bacterium]MBU2430540.1 hypothetical protein [Pseudomonadota bacterium]